MTTLDASAFSWTQQRLTVPLRVAPADVLGEAQKLLREYPDPKWIGDDKTRVDRDWVYAVGIVDITDDLENLSGFPYEIQGLRIGDFALLALMGEPFVEAQLKIKKDSGFPFTMVAHMCNGYVGYVPIKAAFAGGGYETRIGRESRLAPEALEQIENESLSLLKKMRSP